MLTNTQKHWLLKSAVFTLPSKVKNENTYGPMDPKNKKKVNQTRDKALGNSIWDGNNTKKETAEKMQYAAQLSEPANQPK